MKKKQKQPKDALFMYVSLALVALILDLLDMFHPLPEILATGLLFMACFHMVAHGTPAKSQSRNRK
jgi:hypothetical protein